MITNFNYLKLSPQELKNKQKENGKIVYYMGCIIYFILNKIFKLQPKNFYDICPYFEIGTNWGGLECGWFFICSKKASYALKCHEVGHGIQNAYIGGFKMMFLSIGSALRYWYRIIFKINEPPYDSWWFEKTASYMGEKYVQKHK